MAVADIGRGEGRRGRVVAWLARLTIFAIPLVVVALFWYFSPAPGTQPPNPAQAARPGTGPGHPDDAETRRMAARLEARLEREPDDVRGWSVLARTYYVMGRFQQAVRAYEKRVALTAPDADLLADYADALAMANGRSLEGKPMELVREALARNPSQWKALSMAATDAFQHGDYPAAIGLWQRALDALPADSGMAQAIRGSLEQARSAKAAPRK